MTEEVWIALGSLALTVLTTSGGLFTYLLRTIREGDAAIMRSTEHAIAELRKAVEDGDRHVHQHSADLFASKVELARIEERLAAMQTQIEDSRRLTMEVLSILKRRRPDSVS